MSSRILIPSIAGGPVTTWKRDFCSGVTKWSGEPDKSLPLEGSIGLSYSVKEDLAAIYKGCRERHSCWNAVGDDFLAALKGTLKQPTPGFKQEAKPITTLQGDILFDFVDWALGEQPFFLLRKGREVLGLYRKSSSYFYDPSSPLPHRVGFQLVSEVGAEQRALYKAEMSRVPYSLVWLTCDVPREPTEADVLETLRAVRAKVADLTAELDTLLQKLNA